MSANTAAIFPAKPSVGMKVAPGSTNTNTSGTGLSNTQVLDTGAADGTRIDYIRATPIATFSGGPAKINVFITTAAGGTYFLFDQITIANTTVTTTSVETVWEKYYPDLLLGSGQTLEITSVNSAASSNIAVVTMGWDFTS